MDLVRPAGPDFGFNITSSPLLRVKVPDVIAREGSLPLRWIEGVAYSEMTRAEAAHWMSNPVWAALNPDIAKIADVMPNPNYVTVMVPDGVGTLIGADGEEYRTEMTTGARWCGCRPISRGSCSTAACRPRRRGIARTPSLPPALAHRPRPRSASTSPPH
jgi:hypothetical protein